MATFEFVLPELGEGMEAGDVVQVLVTVGDSIAEEQPVLELETDKAVVEVPAPVTGTVKAIHVQAGDKAAAESAYKAAVPAIDRGVSKGLIHRNKAARHKSRLNSKIRAL